MQLIRRIEHHALALRDAGTGELTMELDDAAPTIELPFERPLFKPPHKARIDSRDITEEDAGVAADALFTQVHVDKEELRSRIRRMLQTRPQVSLRELVDAHPLEHGVAEIVAYMTLASDDASALIDDDRTQTLYWQDASERPRQATLPLIVFTR
jgi:hypothetical protein